MLRDNKQSDIETCLRWTENISLYHLNKLFLYGM